MGKIRNAQTEVSRFLSPSVNGLAMYFLRDSFYLPADGVLIQYSGSLPIVRGHAFRT